MRFSHIGLTAVAFFFFSHLLRAQPGLEAYDRGDLETVRKYLESSSLDPAEAAFLRAALLSDADSAVTIYRQIVLNYPESPVSRRATERLRQYYYALGLYQKAKEYEGTPGEYRSLAPPLDSLESEAESIPVAAKPPQPTTSSPAAAANEKPSAKTQFSLQVGAFSKLANAKTLKETLEKGGYSVHLIEARQSTNRLHTVQVVGFQDRIEAQKAAEELALKYGLKPILMSENP